MGAIDTDSINTAWGLLEQVRLEGQHYFDPSKRDELAQLARELGEYIYLRTGKLPSTRIELPLQFYEATEKGVSPSAAHLSDEHTTSGSVEGEQPDYTNAQEAKAPREAGTRPLSDEVIKDSDSSSQTTEYNTKKNSRLANLLLSQWQRFRDWFKPMRSIRRSMVRITDRYRRMEDRAYLTILSGDVDVGSKLVIFGDTPIGRSRYDAELLIHQDIENSPISRWHCTITDEEDHFMLRDEDSANGTYLNGKRLTPIVPYRLKDGDVIELARVERGGVRLLFNVAVRGSEEKPVDVGLLDRAGLQGITDESRGRF